jgi:hypothetical protein
MKGIRKMALMIHLKDSAGGMLLAYNKMWQDGSYEKITIDSVLNWVAEEYPEVSDNLTVENPHYASGSGIEHIPYHSSVNDEYEFEPSEIAEAASFAGIDVRLIEVTDEVFSHMTQEQKNDLENDNYFGWNEEDCSQLETFVNGCKILFDPQEHRTLLSYDTAVMKLVDSMR